MLGHITSITHSARKSATSATLPILDATKDEKRWLTNIAFASIIGIFAVVDLKVVNREILLSFWKVHVLHHAAEAELIGNWMLEELRHHGYDVSPGTLYPLLKRMEKSGWLTSTADDKRGPKAPRSYTITKEGRAVLKIVRRQLRELGVEVGK